MLAFKDKFAYMQEVLFQDLGVIDYQSAWDYQEKLLQQNVKIKSSIANREPVQIVAGESTGNEPYRSLNQLSTTNHFLLLEHPPVYTLGKSGHLENMLINRQQMEEKGIAFYQTNRGGDITFHGPGQIVGYPIIDLEKFYTDIGKYLRNLEQVIIVTMEEFGLKGERSPGETGVWLEPDVKGCERKICALGVRCSRWITMHGFAFNVNTELSYFDHIIPCGITGKQVTSLQKELGRPVSMQQVKEKVKRNFEMVFEVELVET